MKIESKLDFNSVPLGKDHNIRLLLKLIADEKLVKNRMPLNISLVLDRSGSMSGEKLEYVKEAASNLIQRLDKSDYCSLVVFDHEITPLIKPQLVSQIQNYQNIIGSIHAGGNTFLSGGYDSGFEFSNVHKSDEIISRLILLTDGEANNGITDTDQLSAISKKYSSLGVTTSTVGVGTSYNEFLLESMANHGNGNTYYIEDPADAESVFEEELGYILNLTARNCQVKVKSKINGLLAGQMNDYLMPEANCYQVGDLYSGKTKTLVLELFIPVQNSEGLFELGELGISYEDVSSKEVKIIIENAKINLVVLSQEEFAKQTPDREVMKAVIKLLITKAIKISMDYANNQDHKQAALELKNSIEIIESLNFEDMDIKKEIDELKIREENFRKRGAHFYDAVERKRTFYNVSYSSRCCESQKEMMLERRDKSNSKKIIFNPKIDKNSYANYFIVDINTTGIPLDNYALSSDLNNWPRIVEIGWKLLDNQLNKIDKKSYIIKPNGFSIPSKASKLHGITTQKALQEGIDLSEVANHIISLNILNQNTLFVTFNQYFVANTIESEIIRSGNSVPIINWYDLMIEAKNTLGLSKKLGKPNISLYDLYSYEVGLEMEKNFFDVNKDVDVIEQCFISLFIQK